MICIQAMLMVGGRARLFGFNKLNYLSDNILHNSCADSDRHESVACENSESLVSGPVKKGKGPYLKRSG